MTLDPFLSREDGQAAIEYGALAALISVVAVGFLELIGIRVAEFFESFLDAFPD